MKIHLFDLWTATSVKFFSIFFAGVYIGLGTSIFRMEMYPLWT